MLNPQNQGLDIREHPIKGIYIPNLTEKIVSNEISAMELFALGEKERKFAETCHNDYSSRSHTIFRINFEIRDPINNPNKVKKNNHNLYDNSS